jgi:hypothetical protein
LSLRALFFDADWLDGNTVLDHAATSPSKAEPSLGADDHVQRFAVLRQYLFIFGT